MSHLMCYFSSTLSWRQMGYVRGSMSGASFHLCAFADSAWDPAKNLSSGTYGFPDSRSEQGPRPRVCQPFDTRCEGFCRLRTWRVDCPRRYRGHGPRSSCSEQCRHAKPVAVAATCCSRRFCVWCRLSHGLWHVRTTGRASALGCHPTSQLSPVDIDMCICIYLHTYIHLHIDTPPCVSLSTAILIPIPINICTATSLSMLPPIFMSMFLPMSMSMSMLNFV